MASRYLSLPGLLAFCVYLACSAVGCERSSADREPVKPKPAAPKPESKIIDVGRNVSVEIEDGVPRRVRIKGEICLRQGQLEMFMCRKNTKEHESIVHVEADGRDIHQGLLAVGAEPGSPVRYVPRYQPANGQTIKVSVEYNDKGKRVSKLARELIKNAQTGKELETDWVFAGSQLVDNPIDVKKPKIYLANDGYLICVSNFEEALLDLPINSSKDNADLSFEAFTERIPPVGTKVVIVLEPVATPKKDKDK